ncbi:hypothetical protein AB9N12_12870 [Bacteroides sp. AN502(2024)]
MSGLNGSRLRLAVVIKECIDKLLCLIYSAEEWHVRLLWSAD